MAISNVAGALPSINNLSEDVNGHSVSADSLDVEIHHKTPRKISADASQIAKINHQAELYRLVTPSKLDVDITQVNKVKCEKKREEIIKNEVRKGETNGYFIGTTAGLPAGALAGGYVGSVVFPGIGTVAGAIIGGVLGMGVLGKFGGEAGGLIAENRANKAYFCSPVL